jgi:hypothetical protein
MAPTKKELILAVLAMVALPLLGEVALRVAHVAFEPQLYRPDTERGWTLRANVSGVVATETRQFVQINSHGFRDQERAYDKPAGTVRIAVLGNSWTEALQVPLEKTYCSVLEQNLTGSLCYAGRRVEVLNFGVAGYSTAQELLTIQQEVWKYHPDIVIVAFYAARDVANNVRELNNAVDPEQSPYFVYRDDRLVLDDSFRAVPALQQRQLALQNIRYQINENMRLFQAIGAMQRFGKIRLAMATGKERAEKSGVNNLEYSVYASPSQLAMLNAWKVTEGLLLAMRDEVNAQGAEFRIVILATRPQVIPERAKRLELMRKLGVGNLSYADERLKEFGEREGIPVTNLAPVLSDFAETHHVYLNGFNDANWGAGHWNEIGHQLAGEAIAAELCGTANKTRLQMSVVTH